MENSEPDFELPQDFIEWVESPEGQAAFREARETAEQTLRELDEERRLTPEMLLQPMTL